MAYKITQKDNTDPADGQYPYGNVRDNSGLNDGTPANKKTFADFFQFFAALMEDVISKDLTGFDWNGLPDNAYDGFQLFQALKKFKPYKYYVANMNQSGTGAPTATVLENNIGTIVWTRSTPGEYQGTLSGAFPANKTWAISCNGPGGTGGLEGVNILRTSDNTVVLRSYDDATNAPSDDILLDTAIEIRVYP